MTDESVEAPRVTMKLVHALDGKAFAIIMAAAARVMLNRFIDFVISFRVLRVSHTKIKDRK